MSRPFLLLIRHADGRAQRLEVAAGRHVLGRDPASDVVIESQEVSRRHARLELGEKDYLVEDLGSTSGTYVLGRLLTGPQRLPVGHSFQLGTVSVEVQPAGPAPHKEAGQTQFAAGRADSASGRYADGREIGRGGMGVVRQSEDLKLGRQVAMKVMLEGNKKSFDARLRFYQEAEILAKLEHPNIVPVHDLGMDTEGRPFYTMKEVKGVTLQKVLNDLRAGTMDTIRRYPLTHLLGIFLKVCDGVAFAHAKGIVHRDLKPENVMLGEFGEVLVMDWGLAKDLSANLPVAEKTTGALSGDRPPGESAAGLTLDGAVMGTPQYMPPEQAEGRLEDIDERSDVFSLGALLYAILALRPPVEGRTLAEVLENVKSGNIAPPGTQSAGNGPGAGKDADRVSTLAVKAGSLPHCPNGRVPGALSAVAMRALAFERDDRYPSVAMLAADVENYLAGRATSAEQAGMLTLLWLAVKRHRVVVLAVVAVLVATVGLTLGFMGTIISSEQTARTEAAKAREAEASARTSLGSAQIALAEAAFRNLDVTAMAQALDACPPELRDDAWNYFSAKRDSTFRTLNVAGLGGVDAAAAVPGRPGHFAFASKSGGKITIVDVRSDRVLSTISMSFNARPGLAFSGDGRRLAAWGSKDGQVTLLDAVTGRVLKEIEVEKKPGQQQQTGALNPDGSLLAISVGTTAGTNLRLFETDSGTMRWEQRAGNSRYQFHPNGQLLIRFGVTARQVSILNVADGREMFSRSLYSSNGEISPSGRFIAAGTKDGYVHLLNATTGATINSAQLHTGDVYDLAWTMDDRLITVGSQGNLHEAKPVLRVWEPDGFVPLATLFGFKHGVVTPWAFDASAGLLVTVENPPRVWRIPAGLEQKIIPHIAEQGYSMAFVSDRTLLARSGYELGLYDPASSDSAEAAGLSKSGSYRIGASHWGKQRFALGHSHGSPPFDIRLYEFKDNAPVALKTISVKGQVAHLNFDASGDKLVSVHGNGLAPIWSVADGLALGQLAKPAEGTLKQAAFVSGGRIAAFASVKRTATAAEDHLLLYAASGKLLHTVTNHFQIYSLAASPDGKLVAIAGADQSISLYQSDDLKHVRTFRAHDDPVTAIAFHPAKPVIGSASMDRSVKLWDHQLGKPVDFYLGPVGNPVALAFSPSGRYLAVDGQDNHTRVWQLEGRAADAPASKAPPPAVTRKGKTKAKP
jgi:serine/threonine protein kinase/WD40 repeat protein